jgi:hypothetical protein
MEKITLKLTRDQARTVQQSFFPYLLMLIESRLQTEIYSGNVDALLSIRANRILFQQVVKMFDRKLLTEGHKFTFQFTLPNALPLYGYLRELPIEAKDFYHINLRQHIIEVLHRQLSDPKLIA